MSVGWKGFKGSYRGTASDGSDSSSVISSDPFSAAVATVVRAQPKDFKAVRQEWAAIRIQTAFRGFLVIFFYDFIFYLLDSLHDL